MIQHELIDPVRFGVSFSIKQCRNFDIDPQRTLAWLIKDAGFRRFRLMSYWNEHEQQPGSYDFTQLDKQITQITKASGVVTLCLGARQPRWPENHWPDWAWQLPKEQRDKALFDYVATVVNRYKDMPAIISYQLENEALLKRFGERPDTDRKRLRAEYSLVKRLDPSRPIIMTTSTSWGIPLRQPIPDIVGFSYYHTLYRDGSYHHSLLYPWIHRFRKLLIKLLHHIPVFIHELQCEPWGPAAIWKMDTTEQDKSMDAITIGRNIALAQRINAAPVDLWGGEWWYWRLKQYNDPSIWHAVQKAVTSSVNR